MAQRDGAPMLPPMACTPSTPSTMPPRCKRSLLPQKSNEVLLCRVTCCFSLLWSALGLPSRSSLTPLAPSRPFFSRFSASLSLSSLPPPLKSPAAQRSPRLIRLIGPSVPLTAVVSPAEKLEGQLAQLQRTYRIMQGDKQAYAESSSLTLRKQRCVEFCF